MADDDLADFARETFTHHAKTRTVFRLGEGPAVIVIAEIPGITPKVADFGRRVASIGCTAVLPHLFGDPGKDPYARSTPAMSWQMVSTVVPVCISKEFTVLARGRSSPVVAWLRALAAHEHERCGGPGVGAVGMCFTGGFALAMAADDRLLAPVLSQPSLPFALPGRSANADTIDISDADLATVKARCASGGLQVLGLRFTSDRLVPAGRFDFLRRELGDAFVAIELPDEAANPDAVSAPHSVLTEHLIDEEGQPTRDALDRVLDLFRTKLIDPF